MEKGDDEPSRPQLLKMARAYHRSLLVFYLAEPPKTGDRGQDFRTMPGSQPPAYDATLDALIRDIKSRHSIVQSLREEAEVEPLRFIGSASMETPVVQLAQRITQTVGFDLAEYRKQSSIDGAFTYLRSRIEASGIFVLLAGNLGSFHTNIPIETFRGFAIADNVAPFVVVNDLDTHSAWAFTALHEVVHLWLGTTGVSGTSGEAAIEQYCNDVAGEILVPTKELEMLASIRLGSINSAIEKISPFASNRKVSRAMISYKLFRKGLISERFWKELRSHFRLEWEKLRAAHAAKQKQTEGGPSYYVVKRHRLGDALLGLVGASLQEGNITYTKAGQVLGVKARNVDPLLRQVALVGGR
jgi:Zn-dependent peptidase ImmA (M78 family)